MTDLTYPIKLKEYLHSGKFGETDTWNDLLDEGYPEDIFPRYIAHELELDTELHENGDVLITHVNGQKLATPIKNS